MTRAERAGATTHTVGAVDRLLFRVARAMGSLPEGVKIALSGGEPVVRDGYTLDAGIQLILATANRTRKPWGTDPLVIRKTQDRESFSVRGPLPRVHAVHDLEVDGACGKLQARHYAPRTPNAPLLVYFHGGGFMFGDLETHEVGCRLLCAHGDFHVLSVAYRLVPEHRFPAPIDDGQAALAWAMKHAATLGADPARVGIGGDSAGANLSAVVSQLTRGTKLAPVCQVLLYPPTDRANAHPSVNSLADGFLLTRSSIEWFHAQYAASVGADSRDPRISPLLAKDLRALPPALVITAGFDPLRDEGEAYATALHSAGTTVVARRFDGLVHGFLNLTGIHQPSRDAVISIAGAARALLEARPSSDARGLVVGNGVTASQPS